MSDQLPDLGRSLERETFFDWSPFDHDVAGVCAGQGARSVPVPDVVIGAQRVLRLNIPLDGCNSGASRDVRRHILSQPGESVIGLPDPLRGGDEVDTQDESQR
jgi:hypothetical protein